MARDSVLFFLLIHFCFFHPLFISNVDISLFCIAVGHAKMKNVTDVKIIIIANPQSRNSPPTNIPTALFMLLMNKYDPFANSGASFNDELRQYCEIVCIEPSNRPKMINITNTNSGTSIPNANKRTTIAKTIGYITIGRLFHLLMKNPKRLVPNTDAIPLKNK